MLLGSVIDQNIQTPECLKRCGDSFLACGFRTDICLMQKAPLAFVMNQSGGEPSVFMLPLGRMRLPSPVQFLNLPL